MTNAISTATTQDVDGYTTSDFRTEDQWLGEATEHRGKKRELIRLAYVNKFGFSQAKLAQHLNCASSTVQKYVNELLETGELTEEHYQKKMCNSRKPKQTDHLVAEPVENSTPLIHPEVLNHVPDVQPCHSSSSISGRVSNVQSPMDSSSDRCDKNAVPLDTANNGAADEEYNEVLELVDRIKTISSRHYRPNQPGTWTEHQWLNLTELYFTMHSIAEGYSRDYKQERRDYADQCIKQVTTFFDTTDGSSSNRIGGNA